MYSPWHDWDSTLVTNRVMDSGIHRISLIYSSLTTGQNSEGFLPPTGWSWTRPGLYSVAAPLTPAPMARHPERDLPEAHQGPDSRTGMPQGMTIRRGTAGLYGVR